MNELAKRAPQGRDGPGIAPRSAAPGLPTLVSWLEDEVGKWLNPEMRPYRLALTDEQRQAAGAAARDYSVALRTTITREALDRWLRPLATAVGNPPSQALYEGRLDAVMAASAGLPVLVLNAKTYADLVKISDFWPSAAKLSGVLEAEASQMIKRMEALEAIARVAVTAPHADIPKPRDPATSEERAAVRGMVEAFEMDVARRHASQPATLELPAQSREPRFLTPDQLRAAYEEQARSPDPGVADLARMRLRAMAGAGAALSREPTPSVGKAPATQTTE